MNDKQTPSRGFQHQGAGRSINLFKTAPTPQHGAKPDKELLKGEVERSFQPRPIQH